MDAVGAARALRQRRDHLRQLQPHAQQSGIAVQLHLALRVRQQQPSAHVAPLADDALLQCVGIGGRKKRRKGRGQLFHRKAVLTNALFKQIIADQSGQHGRNKIKGKTHHQQKRQQYLPAQGENGSAGLNPCR